QVVLQLRLAFRRHQHVGLANGKHGKNRIARTRNREIADPSFGCSLGRMAETEIDRDSEEMALLRVREIHRERLEMDGELRSFFRRSCLSGFGVVVQVVPSRSATSEKNDENAYDD